MIEALFDEISKFTPRRRRSHIKKHETSKHEPLFDKKVKYDQWQLIVYLFLVLLVYFVFVSRAISIQITNRNTYLGLAEKNRIREFFILPSRGVIYDSSGKVIVRNKPSFSLELNTLICHKEGEDNLCYTAAEEVKKRLDLDDEERILREVDEKRTNILLATGLSKESILPLEANINNMPGVSIETAPARDYLYQDAFAHLIGYVGLGDELRPTIIGKTGVEAAYDKYLSGVSGNKVVQVNSVGTSYRLIAYKDPLPGKDISLFIDSGLQNKAYESLMIAVEDVESEATGGAIVAQNPLDGSVLALVSYPSFDPNLISFGITKKELNRLNNDPRFPFYNRAISATYPPGSTFKVVTASAVLMERIVDEFTTIFDAGFIQVGSFIFRNWYASGHGSVNIIKALQKSNDTYFYTVTGGYGGVSGIGIEKLSYWAEKFGMGRKTGIDIEGEVAGFMPDGTHREWYLGDDYISGIGQGDILSTPLQINNMMTYFANGGFLFTPRIVKSIDGVGETRSEIVKQNMLDEKSYQLVRKGLNLAVEPGGTAYPLFDFAARHGGIKLAGKTGTSEFISPEGEEKTHAWFTVFGPYYSSSTVQANQTPGSKPIVLTVFLEGGGGGSDAAAPVAKELLDYWFSN